jgi:hypothetical protein
VVGRIWFEALEISTSVPKDSRLVKTPKTVARGAIRRLGYDIVPKGLGRSTDDPGRSSPRFR